MRRLIGSRHVLTLIAIFGVVTLPLADRTFAQGFGRGGGNSRFGGGGGNPRFGGGGNPRFGGGGNPHFGGGGNPRFGGGNPHFGGGGFPRYGDGGNPRYGGGGFPRYGGGGGGGFPRPDRPPRLDRRPRPPYQHPPYTPSRPPNVCARPGGCGRPPPYCNRPGGCGPIVRPPSDCRYRPGGCGPIIVRPPPYVPPPVIVRPYPVPVSPRPYVQPYGPPTYVAPAPVYTPPAPAYTPPAPAYTPAPAPAAPTCPCPDLGTYLSIIFQPTATTADMTTFLKAYNLQMASGPNEGGAYRVLVSKEQVPADQLNQLVQSMRSQTNIVSQVSN